MIYKNVVLGENVDVQDNVMIGVPSREARGLKEEDLPQTTIGKGGVIRSGSVIYCDVSIGDNLETGHHVVIREKTRIGDQALIGTHTIIEGTATIGDRVRIQSHAFIPPGTLIGNDVFIGPHAVLTNDKYPLRIKQPLKGPTIRDSVSIGAKSVILPGLEIGEGAMIAAGSVVTRNVPPWTLAKGNPARCAPLPDHLKKRNVI